MIKGGFGYKAAAALVTLALAGGAALAQGPGADGSTAAAGSSSSSKPSGQASGQLSAADRNFLVRAAGSGLFEVEAARMAADKAQDEDVKRYAATLLEHHQSVHQELMGLAQSKGVTLPTSMPGGKRRELNRISRISSEFFDANFVRDVGIREHRQDIRLFSEASRNARDPEVKAWAAKVLPTLEDHMKQARALPAAKRATAKAAEPN